ncbi:DUF6214 family protein [Streptomyces sp. NPDC052236]|uniref:DUF6214 family protein n=1 Tax=Streptomyces sp. NPDC052236 TaxID=3365686 RepID=UPI0037D040E2
MWDLQGHGTVSWAEDGSGSGSGSASGSGSYEIPPPWFNVRLTFADGTRIDVLAVVTDERIAIEDLRTEPPLPLDDFAVLADRIRGPLQDACAVLVQHSGAGEPPPAADAAPAAECGHRRPRSAASRGSAGRRIAAEAYQAAQREGRDPVLAVMGATGRSRRRALRLIAGAREAGLLAPRHNRR